MVKLSVELQQRLRQLGIIDTSLCKQCVAAMAAREEAEAEAALRATQQQGPGRQMWSSLRPARGSTSGSALSSARSMGSLGSSSGGDLGGGSAGDSAPAARALGPRDTLSSLGSALAQLELSDADAALLLERGDSTLPHDLSCPRCRGTGKDPQAHYAYSEEAEMHALQTPGAGAAVASSLASFSPQAAPLKSLLLSERTLSGLVARQQDARASSRSNSMRALPRSTTLVRKAESPSGPIVKPTPERMPRRDKRWLYEQFEELRFGTSSGTAPGAASSSPSLRDDSANPPLTELDVELSLFTRLHTLHLSGQRVSVLQNLPPNIRVVHAYGNRIAEVRLERTANGADNGNGGVKLPLIGSPKSAPSSKAPQRSSIMASASPSPPPSLSPSPFPSLLHLGLGYNALRSLASLLPLASTLRSLDASWNALTDLSEAVTVLRQFGALKVLALQGNPLAMHKYYRAALLDAFATGEGTTVQTGSSTHAHAHSRLDTLDGFATNTHLLKIADYNASAAAGSGSGSGVPHANGSGAGSNAQTGAASSAAAEGGETGRSTARSGSGSGLGLGEAALSDRSPTGSARASRPAPSGGAATGKPSAGPSRRGKKPTPAEVAEAAEAERQQSLRAAQAEAARRAEEERLQSLECHPSLATLRSTPVTLLLVLEGSLQGLPDPRAAFDAEYRPVDAGEDSATGAAGAKGRKGASNAAPTRGGSAAGERGSSASAGGSSGGGASGLGSAGSSQKKKRGDRLTGDAASLAAAAAAAAAADPNSGWFVAETRSEMMTGPSGTVHVAVRTQVRKQVRYYFEYRLPSVSSSAPVPGSGPAPDDHPSNRAVNNQDGNDPEAAGGVNQGTGRGAVNELYRTMEYEWEQLCSAAPSFKPFPLDPRLPAGSPAAAHAATGSGGGLAYAQEVSFAPSVAWRDAAALVGVDVLLYQKEVLESTSETTTTTPRVAAATAPEESPLTDAALSPAGTRRSSGASSNSKREAAAEKKKEDAKKKADKKAKKISPETLPPDVSVSQSNESWEKHTLLGFGHIDLSSMLAVRARKLLSAHTIVAREFQWRKPLGGGGDANGEGGSGADAHSVLVRSSGGPVPLPMQDERGRAQWHPQSERRLPVEVGAVGRAVPRAIERARESGVAVPFPPLLQPPPHVQAAAAAAAAAAAGAQEEKENGVTAASSSSSGAGDRNGASSAKTRGGGGGAGGGGGPRVSAQERERLEREASLAAAAAFAAQQQRDPVYTLQGSLAVYLNCRPSTGVGSAAFRAPPPEPTPEELAAQAAAAASTQSNKRGRKSPAPTKKSAHAAAASDASALTDASADV